MHTSEAYSLLIQSIYNRMHFFIVSVLGMGRRLDYIFKKILVLRSSVSAHTSIAYHIYVYIYIYCYIFKHLERINHVGHGTMHYISCASAYCGANCLSKMELRVP